MGCACALLVSVCGRQVDGCVHVPVHVGGCGVGVLAYACVICACVHGCMSMLACSCGHTRYEMSPNLTK